MKSPMEKIYELKELLSRLESEGGYFIDFLKTNSMEVGILRLGLDEKDKQEPHSVDEIYYVIEGSGFVEINGKDYAIKQGTSIFVPARATHRFHITNGEKNLILLYVLSSHSN